MKQYHQAPKSASISSVASVLKEKHVDMVTTQAENGYPSRLVQPPHTSCTRICLVHGRSATAKLRELILGDAFDTPVADDRSARSARAVGSAADGRRGRSARAVGTAVGELPPRSN